MIKAAIIGGTGMTGRELIRILVNHPFVKINSITSRGSAGVKVADMFPEVRGLTNLSFVDPSDKSVFDRTDVVFVCLPHTEAMEFVKEAHDKKKKVVDLSADYRIQDVKMYEKWYKHAHKYPALLKKAVYGLPEFYREKIKKADVVANPGCYASSLIFGIAPALYKYEISDIIADSKSGVSGSGIKPTPKNIFLNVNENIYPYNTGRSHRHVPEVEEALYLKLKKKAKIFFTPQVIAAERGILSNIYIKTKKKVDPADAKKVYQDFYKNEPFIRVVDSVSLHQVQKNNFCDIAVSGVKEMNILLISTVLDNMVKGASGQAVQNMNLMFGLNEQEGLK